MLSKRSIRAIIVDAKQLYEDGHTLRQIAKRLGVSKTSVRKSLLLQNVDLRSNNCGFKKQQRLPGAPHVGASPYGYCIIKGQLVEVPKEMEVVGLILDFWRKGLALNTIAKELNGLKYKPRLAKQWEYSAIRSIVRRHSKKTSK